MRLGEIELDAVLQNDLAQFFFEPATLRKINIALAIVVSIRRDLSEKLEVFSKVA